MKYAHLEENTNKILGWYDDTIHLEIPTPNIQVSKEVWQNALSINANCYNDGEFIAKDFRTYEEVLEQELLIKLNETQAFLDKTQHKFGSDYEPKEGDDLEELRAKRSEARRFIRENK